MSKSVDLTSNLIPDVCRSHKVEIAVGVLAVAAVGVGGYVYYQKKQQKTQQTQRSSKSREELNKAGIEHIANAQYLKAVDCYTEAINSCPESEKNVLSTLYQNRAAAYEKLENYDMVIADCTDSINVNRNYSKAIRRRARAFERKQLYQLAFQDILKVCALEDFQNTENNESSDRILYLLTDQLTEEYLSKRGEQPVPLSVSYVNDTLLFFTTDPIINRIYASGNGLVNDVEYELLSGYQKAKASLISRKYIEVIPACTEEIDLPRSQFLPESLLLRGTFHIFVADYSHASADLNRVLEMLKIVSDEDEFLNALKCNAYLKLAMMHRLEGNHVECEKALTEAVRMNPNNPDVFSQMGQLHLETTDINKALDDFEKAVNLKPNCPYYNIQRTLVELKLAVKNADRNTEKRCICDLERLAERFPDCAEAQATCGFMLSVYNQYSKATKYLDKALKLAPTSATILVRRGALDIQQDDLESGKNWTQKALDNDPYCVLALESMARYYSLKADADKLVEFYGKAIDVAKSKSDLCRLVVWRESILTQMKTAQELSA